jgi:hypothetical protein
LEFVTPAKTALKVSKIGLGTWQFYGPSTRPGNRYYLHLVMPPYEAVSVWGVRVKRTRIKIVAGPRGFEPTISGFPRRVIRRLARFYPVG